MNTSSEVAPGVDHETHDGMEYSKLPSVLFHATLAEKAELIAEQGLKPNQSILNQSTAVFLSDTVSFAKFCAGIQQEVPDNELVVLAVDAQGFKPGTYKSYLDQENRFKEGNLHEVHLYVPVPPDAIRRLSEIEVGEIEAQEQ